MCLVDPLTVSPCGSSPLTVQAQTELASAAEVKAEADGKEMEIAQLKERCAAEAEAADTLQRQCAVQVRPTGPTGEFLCSTG